MIYLNELVSMKGLDKERLLAEIKKVMSFLKISKQDLSITFCGDSLIQKLNKEYRHKDKPTDVLSFEMDEPKLLGDIIISLPMARKNTKAFGTGLFEEVVFLIVHGILHLLGHDHYKKNEEKKMRDLERQIMFKLFKKEYHA